MRYATVSHDGRHAGRGGLGAVLGAKRLKAVAVRAVDALPRRRPDAVLAAAQGSARALVRARDGEVPRPRARSPTCSRSTRCPRCPGHNFGTETTTLALEDRAAVRDSCASCSIGCERIMTTRDGRSARVEYESAFALGPLRRHRRSRRGPGRERALRRARPGHDLDRRHDRVGDGGRRRRLAALRRRRGAAARDRADRRARGHRRPAGRGLAPRVRAVRRRRSSRCTSRGSSCPATSRARCTRWRSGSPSTRAAPTTTAPGAYEADLSGELDRLDGGAAHVAAAIETEDRAAAMDSLILCKFLRGVFDEPWEEWAALLASVTGWDIDGDELHDTARGIVAAKHAFNRREGWTRAEDTLPARLLDVPLTLPSGREAVAEPRAARRDGRRLPPDPRTGHIRSRPRSCGAAMALSVPPKTDAPTVTCTIDGVEVTVPSGTTIYTAAKQAGIEIPVLCHDERYDPVGVCRMCVVDVGGRVLAAACVRPCEDGMEVDDRRRQGREAARGPDRAADGRPARRGPEGDDHRRQPAARRWRAATRPATPSGCRRRAAAAIDDSNPVISVNHDACILCDRCVRACDDIQGNDVIGRTGKGYATRIAFDLDDPMGESTCVSCGECVAACPTGALVNKPIHGVPIRPREELKAVDSVCPYCGVGCALTYHVDEERGAIVFAEGREQPGNESRLCVKGRYGWDYAASHAAPDEAADPRRPTRRARSRATSRARAAGRKRPGGLVDYDEVLPPFREATWDEALDLAALAAQGDPRPRRLRRDRRLRLGEVLQRGGLPLPEADPRGLRHQQRRSLHAPLPRLERRRAARGRRLRRGLDDLRRHHQRRRRDPRRHEHDGQPPGRGLVLQAGAPARHEADRRRPAARARRRPRRHLLPDQARHRRRVLQRRACTRSSRRGLVDRDFIRDRVDELRRAGQARQAVPAGARRADLRHRRRRRSARSRGCGARPAPASSSGAWGSPSTRRHRQRALPDRDVLDHRQRRPARHRACTRCAARTTCRARPTRA